MTSAPPRPAAGDGIASRRVLPGFVDEHLHIEAWLRSQLSVPVPGGRLDPGFLAAALGDGTPDGEWRIFFGLDHNQPAADCLALAETARETPVLVMHKTGHAAVLNAAGSGRLGLGTEGRVVTEPRGLWSRALGSVGESVRLRLLARLRDMLLAQGVVRVVDATPYRRKDEQRVARLREALRPVDVTVMGDPLDPVPGAAYLKVMDPWSLPGLVERRPGLADADLAVHAIEPAEILLALHSARSGRLRVEHAALCPPAVADRLAERAVVVCANPGFLLERYQAFAALTATGEAEFLHPVASLLAAGCRVVFGSDAPVSEAGVARSVEAATVRGSGRLPLPGEPIALDTALDTACGLGVRASADGTFVVVETVASACSGASSGAYSVVSTVIDGQVCWPPGAGATSREGGSG